VRYGGGVSIGVVIMLLVGLPQVRLFALISIPLGVIVGLVLYLWHRRKAVELADIDPSWKP